MSMEQKLAKKTAIVTGGGKGIGWAACQTLHRDGFQVAILDRDEASQSRADELGENALFILCDVSDEEAVSEAIKNIEDKFGSIDVLVNNAGIQRYSTVTETTVEEWDLVMNVNLKSAFLCAKHVIPYMQKKGQGVIINVSSVQAFISQQNVAPYTTAKTAMLGLTRSIAVDYGPQIRCTAVCPGTIDTPMLRDSIALSPDPQEVYQECVDMHLLKRIGTPTDVGELIAFLASDKATFFTGQAIRVDGGLGIMVGGSKRS
ncbi:MAG: glucose 1-dehydrogenase [Saprospiraceae bacterium]|nr:glucose 1-dehydrogenase [Saprospiraceae bacterium]